MAILPSQEVLAELTSFPSEDTFMLSVHFYLSILSNVHCNVDVCGTDFVVILFLHLPFMEVFEYVCINQNRERISMSLTFIFDSNSFLLMHCICCRLVTGCLQSLFPSVALFPFVYSCKHSKQ